MKFLNKIKAKINELKGMYQIAYSKYPFWAQAIPLLLTFFALVLIALINAGVAIALTVTIILFFLYKATVGQ